MHIGLYFGSFNPIHIGHCIIANYVVNNTKLDQLWLVISPQNPFKISATLLNEYHRLYLAKRAFDGETAIKVSDIEFHLPRPSYTIDTLVYLKEKYPDHQFSIVMGSDGFQNIDRWKNAEVLIKNYDFYVYKRPGFEINTDHGAKITVLNAPLLDISSTYIRDCVRQKKSVRYLLPDAVKEEIERNGYYK